MDDTLCDFEEAHHKAKADFPSVPFPQSIPGFFVNLEPKRDAISVFNWLFDHPKFELYILTAPSLRNPLCYTEKRVWVEGHLGMRAVSRLIISPNKALLKGGYLIDDYIDGKGQEDFGGQFIHFGSNQYPDWLTVKNYFNSL